MKLSTLVLVSVIGLSIVQARHVKIDAASLIRTSASTLHKPAPPVAASLSFCEQSPMDPPVFYNLGNVNGMLSKPAYIEYVNVDNNYYGFLVNNWPGKLLRLDFGNNLLNTPSVTDLGTAGGIIPNNTEGLGIVQINGNWIMIIVGGDPGGGEPSVVVKLDFGENIKNNHPKGVNWGNLGNLDYPHDLELYQENGRWYGLTVNTWNHSITRFDFGSRFSDRPVAENLGATGSLETPTGLCISRTKENLLVYVANAKGNSISLLNFGNSILNQPESSKIDLVNTMPWDVQVIESCHGKSLLVIDARSGELIRIDQNCNAANAVPDIVKYVHPGIPDFPHSISKPFIGGKDLYFFVPDANNHQLTRLGFQGASEDEASPEQL